MSVRMRLEEGTEVRPRRAREAFCRCEQTWDSVTRDMMVCFGGWGPAGVVCAGRRALMGAIGESPQAWWEGMGLRWKILRC